VFGNTFQTGIDRSMLLHDFFRKLFHGRTGGFLRGQFARFDFRETTLGCFDQELRAVGEPTGAGALGGPAVIQDAVR
jgi:hypothetical protein